MTAMSIQSFYDEDGEYHCHNPNCRTTGYSCSNGHTWPENHYSLCHCGWQADSGGK